MTRIDVESVVGSPDLLDPVDGKRLAEATSSALSRGRPLALDFANVSAISSAFANGFFVELRNSFTLSDLQAALDFINLRPRWAQVWAKSLQAVRQRPPAAP